MRVELVSRHCKKLTAVTSCSGLQTQMPKASLTLKWLTSGSQAPWKKGAAGQSSNCCQETDRPTATKSSFLPQRNRKSGFFFFLFLPKMAQCLNVGNFLFILFRPRNVWHLNTNVANTVLRLMTCYAFCAIKCRQIKTYRSPRFILNTCSPTYLVRTR